MSWRRASKACAAVALVAVGVACAREEAPVIDVDSVVVGDDDGDGRPGARAGDAAAARSPAAPSAEARAPADATPLPDLRPFALKAVALWVSHGEATVLFLPNGETALVDTGQDFAVKDYVLPFLASHGIDHLDTLIVTHYHADHCSGLVRDGGGTYVGYRYDASLPRVPVRTFYDYHSFHAGDRTTLGGANVTVLNSAYENPDGGENEKSLSFRLEYGGFVLTFGADIYADQQARILRDAPSLVPANVYKVNHHAHGSILVDYLVRTGASAYVVSAENAVYDRTAYTVDLKNAIATLDGQGKGAKSLLTLEVGNVVVWASSARDWGFAPSPSGVVIPSLVRAEASAYRPRCSEAGLARAGSFRLGFVPSDAKWGYMRLDDGGGFSCKSAPGTSGDDAFPTCAAACPGVAIDATGWAWCASTAGFSCRRT